MRAGAERSYHDPCVARAAAGLILSSREDGWKTWNPGAVEAARDGWRRR